MKKLIILTSDEYIRNYFESNAFSQINSEDCYYCASEGVTYRAPLESLKNFLGYFSIDPKMIKKNTFMFDVLMLRYQKRSVTFKFRFNRQVLGLKNIVHVRMQELPTPCRFVRWLQKNIPFNTVDYCRFYAYRPAIATAFLRTAWNYACIYLFARPSLDKISRYVFEKTTTPSHSLEQIIAHAQPQLVMMPTQAIDTVGNDILRLKRKHSFQVFFLIDNWDNLSSKSVFMYPPDYLGVWGQQSVNHAEMIHHIKNDRVFCLGTPRFENYYALNDALMKSMVPQSPYDFPYVLFVGCSIAFDETTALHCLDEGLKKYNLGRDNPLKVIYRPHPWRTKRKKEEIFEEANFEFVQLDEPMRMNYYTPQGDSFQPSLNYYPALLANAFIVIGPLTTMLLEAALLQKKVLAVAYDDGIHYTSPHNALKYYKHFEGIEKIPGFYFSHSKASFIEDFFQSIQAVNSPICQEQHQEVLQYFLFHDHRTYSERLRDALHRIEEAHSIAS